jgi:transposase
MADASPGDHVAGRHELTLAEWTRIAPHLPARETQGTNYADHRRVLNGMLYRHATWCAWRGRPLGTLPPRYGPWSTVASRQRRWTRQGLWDRILAVLQGELADAGRIDWELWCIDGSHVRAHRVAAGAGGRAQGGPGGRHALREARDPLPRPVQMSMIRLLVRRLERPLSNKA